MVTNLLVSLHSIPTTKFYVKPFPFQSQKFYVQHHSIPMEFHGQSRFKVSLNLRQNTQCQIPAYLRCSWSSHWEQLYFTNNLGLLDKLAEYSSKLNNPPVTGIISAVFIVKDQGDCGRRIELLPPVYITTRCLADTTRYIPPITTTYLVQLDGDVWYQGIE